MIASRLANFGTTIFTEMSALAEKTGAINLGQGFPDEDGPAAVLEAAQAAMRDGRNQYAPLPGVPALRHAIAEHQQRFYGIELDPATQVQVTMGATEALTAAILGLCEPGDDVLAFDPYYDSYPAAAAMTGARFVPIPLNPPDFTFDEIVVPPEARAIIVNSPHNPTGRVFTREELQRIADVVIEHDLIAITDEVYEHLVFDGQHVPLASLPGMRERTVAISSTGKTFSFTGWKIGWACTTPELSRAIRTAHQFVTFCNGTPFQYAMAKALALPDAYYKSFTDDYRVRRDRLCDGLRAVGFEVLVPAGTYFVCVDIRPLGFDDDMELCRRLPEAVGVAAIPNSAFYLERHRGKHLVRFAFCKSDAVLDEGIARLRANIGRLRAP